MTRVVITFVLVQMFNLRRLQAHRKTKAKLIRELLFADAAALVAHTVVRRQV